MFFTSHSDQPTVDGPVGRFITHSPVGPDRILSACDPDRPVADGPVGQSFILGPVGPRRTFSLNELNQPVAVGPVDQPFTTGPVGNHEKESDCKQMDRIADSPVGSTEILDQVKQTGSPIQTDFMKLGPITELHRSSQPKQLFSEAVDDGPCLTVQNPADVVGETVFDCRPSVLPVSIPHLRK